MEGGVVTEAGAEVQLVDAIGGVDVVDTEQAEGLEESQPMIDTKAQENYRAWKTNSVALYDYLNTYNHVWPSLTVQFFPDKDTAKPGRTTYRLLTSTYTSSLQPQHLQIGSITKKPEFEEANLSKYDPDLQEFATSDPISGKFRLLQQILVNSTVNKARYMPQNPDLIGTICEDGSVSIFDKTKHASNESDGCKVDVTLKGHAEEGFALDWNCNAEGLLLSGAMDSKVKLWDITKFSTKVANLDATNCFTSSGGINDVEWCPQHHSMFITGDETNALTLWDIRQGSSSSHTSQGHANGVNAVSWNRQNKFCVASGDGDGNVHIWDVRNLTGAMSTLRAHEGAISCVNWNPVHGQVLMTSGSEDPVVKLWDVSDGRCMFKHCGHLLGINDASWNANDPWMVASVSNDNTLHLWQPSIRAMVPE